MYTNEAHVKESIEVISTLFNKSTPEDACKIYEATKKLAYEKVAKETEEITTRAKSLAEFVSTNFK